MVKFYIEPNCQQFNPADEEEETHSLVTEPVFSRIQKYIDGQKRINENHLFVLADAGMGKTSLLVILKLFHITSLWSKNYDCYLLKLGESSLDEIAALPTRKTVLLLDALDEDNLAWGRTMERLEEILKATKNFYRVIITCRTQFFSGGTDPFNNRGRVEVAGYLCPTIYLSLFENSQVMSYLKKRYSRNKSKINNSVKILDKIHKLKLRPMVLAHIDEILGSEYPILDEYTLYKALIDSWLMREYRKENLHKSLSGPDSRESLWSACKLLSIHMFGRLGGYERTISMKQIDSIVSDLNLRDIVSSMEIEGRSLLNKDSEGLFRFSHFSIQEYLFAKAMIDASLDHKYLKNNQFKVTNLVILFLLQGLEYADKYRPISIGKLGLKNIIFNSFSDKHIDISQLDFERASLIETILNKVILRSNVFFDVKFENCNLRESEFYSVRFENINATNTVFDDLYMKDVEFTDSLVKDNTFIKCRGEEISFKNCQWKNIEFSNVGINCGHILEGNIIELVFIDSHLKKMGFDGGRISGLHIKNSTLDGLFIGNCAVANFDVTNCTLENSNFDNTSIQNADFAASMFVCCSFASVDFEECDLSKIKFIDISFHDCTFKKCRVSHRLAAVANLTNIESEGNTFLD